MSLFDSIENILNKNSNITRTENGAITLKSSGSALLDFFSRAGAMREVVRKNSRKANQISVLLNLFLNALKEDEQIAILILFYLRDVRGGQGERAIFKLLFSSLCSVHPELAGKVLHLIPEYGRWDDLLKATLATSLKEKAFDIARLALFEDGLKFGTADDISKVNISLCAKWMPSENAGKESKKLFKQFVSFIGLTPKEYRNLVSTLRKHLDIVERKMCAKEFSTIDYSKIPSKAAFMYRNAFKNRDTVRYQQYLESLQRQEKGVKINASTLYPYEIVKQIVGKCPGYSSKKYDSRVRDITLEEQWKALPNYLTEPRNAIAVVDTSGSMYTGNGNFTPIDVSVSLGMYLAERNPSSIWKDKFITFDTTPRLTTIKGSNVTERILNVYNADWGGTTDLQKVFDLILNAAKKDKLSQEELPEVIYIISDMQFNSACDNSNKSNFEKIDEKFKKAGYSRPKLIFWNVSCRVQESPVSYDEHGTALVSGFSPSIFKSLFTHNFNPVTAMLETVLTERYYPILEALNM